MKKPKKPKPKKLIYVRVYNQKSRRRAVLLQQRKPNVHFGLWPDFALIEVRRDNQQWLFASPGKITGMKSRAVHLGMCLGESARRKVKRGEMSYPHAFWSTKFAPSLGGIGLVPDWLNRFHQGWTTTTLRQMLNIYTRMRDLRPGEFEIKLEIVE